MTVLLETSGLQLGYGSTLAVKGISIRVEQGSVVCLIGANGAGKTTTLRGLSGLIKPRQGEIRFGDRNITGWPAYRISRLGIAQVPEGRQVFSEMSVAENLRMGAYLVSDAAELQRRRDGVLGRFPRLAERLSQAAGSLSGGEQQMLALGRALMAEPELLLLDEPSMGLAPLVVEEIFNILASLKREGRTILVVEQNAHAALEIADYAYVMESGRITLDGPADSIARNPAVLAAYLGAA